MLPMKPRKQKQTSQQGNIGMVEPWRATAKDAELTRLNNHATHFSCVSAKSELDLPWPGRNQADFSVL
jgi:hypothetical protein